MSTITLPNIRVSSDLTVMVRLKDGGLAIDWSTLNNIKAHVYSDAQRALAGRCAVSVDTDDHTVLVCEYSANKPQYLGVNRIVVQARYMGETKTYDKPAFNFVRWTDDQEGEEITISDPDVDVEIDVEDVTSSILQNILDACIQATEEAREVVDVGRGPRGYSAYEVAVQDGYEGTEEEWLESLVGPAGESAYQLAVDQGYEGTLPEWLASLHGADGDSAYQIAVEEGFVGTKAQWLASLVGPQGLSAYQVAVVDGYQGTVSEWLASLVGPVGPTPAFSIGTVSTGAAGTAVAATITGTAAAPVLNLVIPKGDQGNTGSSVDYPYELVNNRTTNDATKGLSAAEGYRLGQDLSQLEAEVTDLDGRTEKIEDVIPGDSVSYTGKIVTLENVSSLPTVSGSNDYTFAGKNLFDVSTRVFGKIKNDSGAEVNDGTSTYFSGYIPVYGGVKISSSITIQRIYLYTPNKEWIGRYGNNLTTFDVPATHNNQTVGWMQIQMAKANVSDTMMVNYGANPLTFEAYKSNAGTEYYSDYTLVYDNLLADIEVTVGAYANLQEELVSGDNIKTINGESILGPGNIDINFDVGMEDIVLSGNIIVLENTLTDAELPASANVVGRNLVDGSSQVFKKIKNDSGTEVSDATSSYYTTFIPAIGGTTLSANVTLQRIYYYDVNKNWIGRSSGATDSKTREVPATVSNTAVGWVQVQIPHGQLPQEGLMVNFGGTAFAYEAYKTNNTPVLYPGYSVVFASDLSTITISGKSLFMMALPQISVPEMWEPSWVESGYSSPIGSQNTIRANWEAPNKYLYYDFLDYYYDSYIGGSYADKYKVTKRSLGDDCSNLGYEMFEYDFCPANYTKVVLLSAGMNTNETSGIWGVATFVHELMNPAEQTMRWLHDNVRFIILPIICPSSFDQTPLKYENYNGVRVNKNFNYKDSWNYIHNNYTNQKEGAYPDSEAETLNLKRWINKYSGIADFYIDCHSDDDSRGDNYNTILTQVICSDSVIKSKIDATFPALVAFYTDKGYIPAGVTAKTQSWVEGGTIYPKTVYAKNFCQIPSIMIEQYICSTMYGSDGQTNNDTYGIKNYCAMLRMYVMAALVQNATAVPTGVIPMNGYRVNYK